MRFICKLLCVRVKRKYNSIVQTNTRTLHFTDDVDVLYNYVLYSYIYPYTVLYLIFS